MINLYIKKQYLYYSLSAKRQLYVIIHFISIRVVSFPLKKIFHQIDVQVVNVFATGNNLSLRSNSNCVARIFLDMYPSE